MKAQAPESIDPWVSGPLSSGLEGKHFRLEAVSSEALERPHDGVLALLVELQMRLSDPDAGLKVFVAMLINVDLKSKIHVSNKPAKDPSYPTFPSSKILLFSSTATVSTCRRNGRVQKAPSPHLRCY